MGNTPKATAYLTITGDEIKEEAYMAQAALSLMADSSKNIFTIGGERLRIDPAYYTSSLAIMVNSTESSITEGQTAFQQLWDVQQKFNQLTNEYQNFYDNLLIREQLTQSDIDYTIETANWMNLYQYETLSILLNQKNVLRVYSNYLMTTKEWKLLSKDQRIFVSEITQNMDRVKESLRSLALIEKNDPEKLIELNLEKAKIDLKQGIEKQQQYIRYPV